MRRLLAGLAVLAAIALVAWWWLTLPDRVDPAAYADLAADPERGATVFAAAGCASCHAAPDAEGDERLVLSGGERFPSDFGTFVAPNISPHPEHGVGDWTDLELVNAIVAGVSPGGAHYYPAFPYSAYTKAEPADVVALVAYLRTLPASDVPSLPHDVGFPFNIRRNVGLWKLLFLNDDFVLDEATDEEVAHGRYLVEALGHCGECHTSRNLLGGLDTGEWLGGAPNPTGRGRIPNITPAGLEWSIADIAAYLDTGFTPDFDTAGGLMAEVVRNTAQLSDGDRAAIAAYLKAVPPVE